MSVFTYWGHKDAILPHCVVFRMIIYVLRLLEHHLVSLCWLWWPYLRVEAIKTPSCLYLCLWWLYLRVDSMRTPSCLTKLSWGLLWRHLASMLCLRWLYLYVEALTTPYCPTYEAMRVCAFSIRLGWGNEYAILPRPLYGQPVHIILSPALRSVASSVSCLCSVSQR